MSEHPTGLRLELASAFAAPRDRLFRTLTEPIELAKWWGPRGFTTPEIELAFRVGGRYRFSMKPAEGEPFHLSGEFLEIDPPRRLVYTFRWDEPTPDDRETVVTLSLEAHEEATTVFLTQGSFATEERLALHRSGWTESFAKLQELVQRSR